MKKSFKLNNIAILLVVFVAILLQSCSKEDTYDVVGSKENKVYINIQSWNPINTPKNTVIYNVTNTPVGSLVAGAGRVETKFGVQCTHIQSRDIVVKLEIDNSIIRNGFMQLPGNVTVLLNKTELTIPKGSSISSDSVQISISSEELYKLPVGTYMIPVKIVDVKNSGTAISTNQNAMFLVLDVLESNVFSTGLAADMVGSLVTNKTGWTGTVNAPLVSGTPASMFSGTNTYWRVNPQVFQWSVDMVNEQVGITGIRIHTNTATYNFTKLKVFSSNDGINWVSQGITDVVIGNAYQYLKFYETIDARHIKFEVLGWRSTAQIRVALYDIYVAPI